MTHDPWSFVRELAAKLATRSRHVCVFIGAGVGNACGLPDINGLEAKVKEDLDITQRSAFDMQLSGRNLEQVLSRLRRIAGLLSGDQKIDDLTAALAEDLDRSVCKSIIRALDLAEADMTPVRRLAAWAARADYRLPVEIFTVNYDLLLETALESLGVPYFDGFVGSIKARFCTELVEATVGTTSACLPSEFVRLWKLHGSVNWAWSDDEQIIRLGQPVPEDLPAAIYPSDAKYEESRRVPFVVLQDRFRRALHEPETLVLISGYSCGDAHLNEMLFDAATRRQRSEFVVFCYSDIPSTLAERAERTPNLQVVSPTEAVVGGLRRAWKGPDDEAADLWVGGKMVLSDFKHLAAYLARSSSSDEDELLQPPPSGAPAATGGSGTENG
jgi:hypothetical protein